MDSTPVRKTIPFRLIAGSGLLLILVIVLMDYLEEAHRVLEIQSVEQQKRVINSALVVVFSTYAVERRLHELQQLDGANPFIFLRQFSITLNNYRGEARPGPELATGWYYDESTGEIFFQPVYLQQAPRLKVIFDYVDLDANGKFEKGVDRVRSLRLQEFNWL